MIGYDLHSQIVRQIFDLLWHPNLSHTFFSSTIVYRFFLVGMFQKLQNQNSSGCPTKMKYQRSWESPNVARTQSFSRNQVWKGIPLRIKIGFDGLNWLQCPSIETATTWIFQHLYLITCNPEVSGGSWWDLELLWFEGKKTLSNRTCVHLVYNSYYHTVLITAHIYTYIQ